MTGNEVSDVEVSDTDPDVPDETHVVVVLMLMVFGVGAVPVNVLGGRIAEVDDEDDNEVARDEEVSKVDDDDAAAAAATGVVEMELSREAEELREDA